METEKLTMEYLLRYWNPYLKISYGRFHWDIVRINFNVTKDQLTLRRIPSFFTSVPISDCKLILRPLSSLTDEGRNFLSEIDFKTEHKDIDIYNGFSVWGIHITTTDYLRSINIDIDGLQEKGVAVYD